MCYHEVDCMISICDSDGFETLNTTADNQLFAKIGTTHITFYKHFYRLPVVQNYNLGTQKTSPAASAAYVTSC